jgi:hypothetical protein
MFFLRRFLKPREEPADESIPLPEDSQASEPEEELDESFGPNTPEPDDIQELGGLGYRTSREHLLDELRRIDQYVRAQMVRWRETVAAHKPEEQWGMVRVTGAEVDAFLDSSFNPADGLTASLEQRLQPYWQAASKLEDQIRNRLQVTPDRRKLRLQRLVDLFSLNVLERDLLLVCLLPEMDGRYRRLYGYLQDDASRTQPTVELAMQILHPAQVATAPENRRLPFQSSSPLMIYRLVELGAESSRESLNSMRALRLDERITAYLLNGDDPDARLNGILSTPPRVAWRDLYLDAERLNRLHLLATWWRKRLNGVPPGAVIFLHGPYGAGRLKAAAALCGEAGTRLLVANVPAARGSRQDWRALVMLAYREAALQNAALYWAGCETLLDPASSPLDWETLTAAAEAYPGLTFLASENTWDPAGRFRTSPFTRLDFPIPDYQMRGAIWEKALEHKAMEMSMDDQSELLEEVARSFQLTEGQIYDAISTAEGEALRRKPGQPLLRREDIYEGCRRQSGRKLISFAHRTERRVGLTLENLILPDSNKRMLHELLSRIRLRDDVYIGLGYERRLSLGNGMIVLFTGTSGTGKTMAAELLAQETQTELYRVDLSAITSKWVGETEKNLERVFAEAQSSSAILFFDEADALFGKRGEVKEAQDRWANMEVNYLLQRIEEYRGTVILASNLRQNIDAAFMRRIHWVVDFPFPDEEARCKIFKGAFSSSVNPPSDWRLRVLARRFRLTGGSIKNIVVDATFRALSEERAREKPLPQTLVFIYPPPPETDPRLRIPVRCLVLAAAREYQKLGKPITISEFGKYFYDMVNRELLQQGQMRT